MKSKLEKLAIEQLFTNSTVDFFKKTEDTNSSRLSSFEDIMMYLLNNNISDLHFSSKKSCVTIYYRYNTELIKLSELEKDEYKKILTKIQIMSKIDIINNRDPADGSFTFLNNYFRVSLINNNYGTNCVIRKLKTINDLTVENLKYPEEFLKSIESIKLHKDGLIIFSGPTGSGKTTSLAFIILQLLKEKTKKIITIENPLEYIIPGAEQIEIKNDSQKTSILKNILRHDPDIIMTGEIRTDEFAKLTLESAMTGHYVFSTIHANNVFNAIQRLELLGLNKSYLLDTLKIIYNQRFVKILCSCNKKGCETCKYTGYSDIIPVFEILHINEYTKQMILSNKIDEIKNSIFYISPEIQLNRLLIQGKIDTEEYNQFITSIGG
ncbi:hypothetical protein LN42_01670 [Marinitoga sp. 1137]|uniref:GspE/PulE family protein n=1 Tax=Marinitoga sp. 1137 TaxID=1545835 RepID=UPI0009506273|nr:ATPase, T2SS/T4P/T4SS family [Marinitoga sp. 1137]APT75246.1 hypothetical protein LN42_01670 [Marinitoga sp. 1137]